MKKEEVSVSIHAGNLAVAETSYLESDPNNEEGHKEECNRTSKKHELRKQ